ncbi:MAG: radical SAM protein [Caldisericaceae bacterium]|nr:radical SAM protein [Caldisericaceae bacterium]
MSLGENAKKLVLSKTIDGVVSYLQKNPERNVYKAIDTVASLANKFSFLPVFKEQINGIKKLADNDRPGIHLLINLMKDTRPDVAHKLAKNFVVNAAWMGIPKQREYTKKEKVNVPWFLLIDPTEKCNYNCIGCWAGSYDQAKTMSFETLDRILTEAKEMGIYFIVLSGGEPTLYPHFFEILKKHNDMAFMFYTNGSIITEKFAEKLADAGNAVPCISVEGFKEKTDWRRGKGAWDRVIKAMDNLKKVGVPFGYSVTETNQNIDEILSDEFVDFMVNKGAKIAWYFQYIPIGRTPDVNLMLTPQQRLKSYQRIHEIRATKPLFAADFWNDGPYTGGCLAGGRRYIHITADGGIEPCAFIHLSQGNINDMSLKEALQLPFFKEIQKLQPYSDNLLSPCLLVDHPDYFRKIGSLPGVRGTDGTLENMYKEVGKHLDRLSKEWEELSRPVFERDFPEVAKKTREYKKKKEELIKKGNGDIEQFYVSDEIDK